MTKPPPPPRIAGSATIPAARLPARSWSEVLALAGYPSNVLVIDMETFFSSTYGMGGTNGLSTIEYVQDERFEILGCAFLPFGEEPFFQVGEEMVATQLAAYQRKYGDDLGGVTVVMQNAMFDALILSRKFNIHPPHLIDTLCLARHWNSRQKHGLATLAPQFGLPEKGETKNFSGVSLRHRFAIPKGRGKAKMPVRVPIATAEQLAALSEYAINDVRLEGELFKILLPKLSNPVVELKLQKHTLELWTRPLLRLDAALGEEITQTLDAEIDAALDQVRIDDVAMVYNGLPVYESRPVTRDEISGNKTYEALLVDAIKTAGENPQTYFKRMKRGYKLADAKSDPERSQLLNHPDTRVRSIALARAKIKSSPLHVSRIERLIAMAKADGGNFPTPIRYCGAHTGRWSGSEKVNVQNLPKDGILAKIKNMLVAPDGHTLVIVDLASIEARVTAWIAGQDDLCEAFRNGDDIYSSFASRFFHTPVRKPRKGGIPAIETLMGKRRQFGKVAILGLGYGMGAAKFADFAGTDEATAKAVVKLYRETYPLIPRFWYDAEKAFCYTARYRRACALPRNLAFDSLPDIDVAMTLPNTRTVNYAKVRIAADRYGDKLEIWTELEHKWEHAWGGVITENIVQAISRDVLAEAMLRIEDAGYRTALHCHDELVIVAPESEAGHVLELAIAEMARVPVWAVDLPLAAEGCISKFYRK